jgi:lysophospholipase L1-like esterase
MQRTQIGLLAGICGLALLTGCSPGSDAASPQTTPTQPSADTRATTTVETDGFDLVVIGDSLIDPTGVCNGCTGFAEQFASHLEDALGAPVAVDRVMAMTVPDAQSMVESDDTARTRIAQADVVVVEVGYNNAMPDPETGIGCGGSIGTQTATEIAAWLRSTEPECLASGVATYGALYDQIFAGVRELRGEQPTVYIATTTIDGNIDESMSDSLLGLLDPADRPFAEQWTLDAYDRWNTMLAERATAAGFDVVDLYHEFNGPDGTQPSGELAVDSAHPSQKGNDAIAAKLAEVDVSILGG